MLFKNTSFQILWRGKQFVSGRSSEEFSLIFSGNKWVVCCNILNFSYPEPQKASSINARTT